MKPPRPALSVGVVALALLGAVLVTRVSGPSATVDLSHLAWTQALDSLAVHLHDRYPYTAWKRVSWSELAVSYRPLVQSAEASRDTAAYRSALEAFVGDIPGRGPRVWAGERSRPPCRAAIEILGGGHGRLRPCCGGPRRPQEAEAASAVVGLDALVLETRVDGIVLDLRGCGSAEKSLVELGGRFLGERALAERVSVRDARDGSFGSSTEAWVDPWAPRFTGRVAILVDGGTAGAAELLAVVLRRSDAVRVIGYESSAGLTQAGDEVRVRLPADLTLGYFSGQSLDAHDRIQIETDRAGIGGLAPDLLLQPDPRAEDVGRDPAVEAAQRWLGFGRLE